MPDYLHVPIMNLKEQDFAGRTGSRLWKVAGPRKWCPKWVGRQVIDKLSFSYFESLWFVQWSCIWQNFWILGQIFTQVIAVPRFVTPKKGIKMTWNSNLIIWLHSSWSHLPHIWNPIGNSQKQRNYQFWKIVLQVVYMNMTHTPSVGPEIESNAQNLS